MGLRALTRKLWARRRIIEIQDKSPPRPLRAPDGADSVSSAITSVDDILKDPKVLSGKTTQDIEAIVAREPGWRVETLGKGSKKGQGWVLRQYTDDGKPTGNVIRWHPGGGHHGPDPYWRVSSHTGGKSDIIR